MGENHGRAAYCSTKTPRVVGCLQAGCCSSILRAADPVLPLSEKVTVHPKKFFNTVLQSSNNDREREKRKKMTELNFYSLEQFYLLYNILF